MSSLDDHGLDGETIPPMGHGVLAQNFMLPPFSVLNAREGAWQNRKRRWLAIGIQSELGRAGNTLGLSDSCEEYRYRAGDFASPGGSPRPACDYSKKERGDGAGRPIRKHTASLKGGLTYGLTMTPYEEQQKKAKRHVGENGPTLDGTGGRDIEISAANSGTSIFDPVLTELMYKWFCPPGGQILDPFAGGSVRGIVAAKLGFKYWGCDLSAAQIRANYVQAYDILWKGSKPNVRTIDGKTLVDDAHLPGGTKQRVLVPYLRTLKETDVVYAGPCEGFAQCALAISAAIVGKRAHLFLAKRNTRHIRTIRAAQCGAIIHEVENGYLNVVKARAAEFVEHLNATVDNTIRMGGGAKLLPFGLDDPVIRNGLTAVAAKLGLSPAEFWVTAGSGTLCRALAAAWPQATSHAIRVGAEPKLPEKKSYRYDAPEKFSEKAKNPPPYDATDNYDAKLWQFAKAGASPGAVIWNVAGNNPSPFWANGDSGIEVATAPKADFIFSCPPYGDLERYSDDNRDLSTMSFKDFCEGMDAIVSRACEKLNNDRFAAFVVGDYRSKEGTYRNFPAMITRSFQRAGLKLYNECILVTAVGSLSIRTKKQFDNSRKLGRTHQTVLIFVKGDPIKATRAVQGKE